MIKLIVGILILACGSLFFIKGPDGKPLMSLDELSSGPKSSAAETNRNIEPTKVYKWQDEDGVWQFSNTPVAEHEAEVIVLDGQINTMDAYVAPKKVKNAGVSNSFSALPSGLTTVSPDKISEMMDSVNNLQNTVDQRKAEIDRKSRAN
jgi:hypothetical protein